MKKLNYIKKEIHDYILMRLTEEDLKEYCKNILFDNYFYGLLSVNRNEKYMIINLKKWFEVSSNTEFKNTSLLILFQAIEHEIEHLKQFRNDDNLSSLDTKQIMISKSFELGKIIEDRTNLYHEYNADINSIVRLNENNHFKSVLKTFKEEDVYDINKYFARRIFCCMYHENDTSITPITTCSYLGLKYGILNKSEYEVILEFLNNKKSEYENILDGRRINKETSFILDSVSKGKENTKNILNLIKK